MGIRFTQPLGIYTLVILCALACILYITSQETTTLASSIPCRTVETIFARGSGQNIGANEAMTFMVQLDDRLSSPIAQNFYELGTETHGGNKYPAIDISNAWNGNAIGAKLSAGYANDYGESVSTGVRELRAYITERHEKCKSYGSKFVLAGYSQGAQVVGQSLSVLDAAIKSNIIYVALFGDPKLHLPEGEGIYPPACRGKDLSAYRRVIGSCNVDNGALGARKPYLPTDMHAKTGLWCYVKDFICGSTKNLFDSSGHGTYASEGNAVDSAVYEAASRLRSTLPTAQQSLVSVDMPTGMGTTGLDVVFIIDTTGSMYGQIEQAKQFATQSAAQIQQLRGRVALVAYRDLGDEYTARVESPFSSDLTDFQAKLSSLVAYDGGDAPEATLHAIMTAFNGLDWQHGASKAAIILTDADFHNPDLVDGSTIEQVARRSLEIDPVNIYPVVPAYIASEYESLATLTSGQVIIDEGNSADALFSALTKLEQRPTALLKNTEYHADIGQEITFDASDSYVIDAEITSYEWDFDGDGVFEEATTHPVVEYTYSSVFDGSMQVRLTASNGTIASISAFVTIGTYQSAELPAAPASLRIASLDESEATVSWEAADSLAVEWLVLVDGTPLGRAPLHTTTLTVTDLDRTKDNEISVAAIASGGDIGKQATVIAPAQQTQEQPQYSNVQSVSTPSTQPIRVTSLHANTTSATSSWLESPLLAAAAPSRPQVDATDSTETSALTNKSTLDEHTPLWALLLIASVLMLSIVSAAIWHAFIRRNAS